MRFVLWSGALVFALASFDALAFGQAERFVAELADGTRIAGDEIRNWHETKTEPSLANRNLWDAANPARWVIDTTLRPETAALPCVEFVNGDRLTGRVVAAHVTSSPFHRTWPHLSVELPEPLQDGNLPAVRVALRWARKIVWKPRASERYEPSTLFYSDGRQSKYRAVRWNPATVSLLVEQDTIEVPFGEIAELHLPAVSPWDAWFEQLAILAPDFQARLMQFESTDGLRLTGSLQRFQARPHGNAGDPNSWRHMLQPAWSLDTIWVRHRTIRSRRFFSPQTVPLTLIPPAREEQHPLLAGARHWQRDRSVLGAPLQTGTGVFGWGYGVQAQQTLEFPLHPTVRTFRTRIGLDQSAGRGGCARAAVMLAQGSNAKPLFQSDFLIGSQGAIDSGVLSVAGDSETHLVLSADPAHTGRPAGADPFDIRDHVDWLEPEFQLDVPSAHDQMLAKSASLLPAWDGWSLDNASAHPAGFSNHWDPSNPRQTGFVLEAGARLPFLTLKRQLKPTVDQSLLIVNATRFGDGNAPSKLQLRINGETIGRYDIPIGNGFGDPPPVTVSLKPWLNQKTDIEITHLPGGPDAKIQWRGLAFARRNPGLQAIFAGEPAFADRMQVASGEVGAERLDVYSGPTALRVTGEAENPRLPGLAAAIREHPRLGEFRYLSFAWKKRGGGRICLKLAHDGQWGEIDARDARQSFRIDAGPGRRSYGSAQRVDENPPKEWTVVVYDLVQNFGEFTLTGLGLSQMEEGEALIDQVFLARTLEDAQKGLEPESTPSQPLVVFEDQWDWLRTLTQSGSNISAETNDVYSGHRALRVTHDQRADKRLPRMDIEVREHPGPGEYRFVRFAWKKKGGELMMVQFAGHRPGAPPPNDFQTALRYEAGKKSNGWVLPAIKVDPELPREWKVVTRDLFADYGEFTITGMALAPQDGEYGLFDHVVFGRTLLDLDRAAPGKESR
ncbi:MAG TPA: NPCBM/NEW2 domain-containing protein [Planctomycetaceae bacterium]|nr:NPCBM/NEW2 domain-containing protein [Planctomycetaceae bacterium]